MKVQSDVQNNMPSKDAQYGFGIVSLNHSYLISSNYILQSELIECGMPTENPPFK